jgi:hypothetical protein
VHFSSQRGYLSRGVFGAPGESFAARLVLCGVLVLKDHTEADVVGLDSRDGGVDVLELHDFDGRRHFPVLRGKLKERGEVVRRRDERPDD